MVNKGIGIEVQVKTAVGLGKDTEGSLGIISEIDHMTDSQSRNRDRSNRREEGQRSRTESRDRNRESRSTTRSRFSSHVILILILTGTDLDALDVVNMITLQENALML